MVLLEMLGLVMTRAVETVFAGKAPGRGWGENINWVHFWGDWNDHYQPKPMMLVVHDMTSPVCQRIAPLFAAHSGIRELSQYFTMVNCDNSELPDPPSPYTGDTHYVPRFMFYVNSIPYWYVTSQNADYRFLYEDMDLLAANMKRVLEIYPREP